MRYCTRCVLPDTKPHATFDEQGVCGGCRAAEAKNDAERGTDWAARRAELAEIVEQARSRGAPLFDVLVPVSGGKDSIAQVARLLPFEGLRILAVNVDYGVKTEIGRHNLSCVSAMGASLVTYRPQEPLQTRLIRIGLEDYGDPDLMSHALLHAFPLHAAIKLQVPLVLLGENSAAEYGGAAEVAGHSETSRAWFEKYAANDGRGARLVSERYDIPFEELRLYDFPDELADSGVRATFTSHWFHWDSETNLGIAREYGFQKLDRPSEGTYRDYVGLDEKINRLHQYLKVLKFGYGRATDHACEDIRNGRLTRDQAKELVRRHDLEPLSDDAVDGVLEWLGYTRTDLDAILERYRNTDIWARDAHGDWCIPHHLEDEVPV
jgi:N-acetyl sugar amidotransferase